MTTSNNKTINIGTGTRSNPIELSSSNDEEDHAETTMTTKPPGNVGAKSKNSKTNAELLADTSDDDDDYLYLGEEEEDDDDKDKDNDNPVRKRTTNAVRNHGTKKSPLVTMGSRQDKISSSGYLFSSDDEKMMDDFSVDSIDKYLSENDEPTKASNLEKIPGKKKKKTASLKSTGGGDGDDNANKPPPGLTDGQLTTWNNRNDRYSNSSNVKKRGLPLGSTKEEFEKKKQKNNKGVKILSELKAHNPDTAPHKEDAKRKPKKTNLYTDDSGAAAARKSNGENSDGKMKVVGRDIEVGTRVYAEFPADGFYYWGKITKKYRPKFSRFHVYDVLFDDGDEAEHISGTKICTEEEYKEMENALLSSAPEPQGSAQAAPAKQPAQETKNLQTSIFPCEKCSFCLRPDCGRCFGCQNNAKNGTLSGRLRCFQRMCLAMDVKSKELPAKFGFPKGWTFVFDEQLVKPSYKGIDLSGLVILAPNTRQYYLVDKAMNHNPTALAGVDEDGFYAYVGVDRPPSTNRGGEKRAVNAVNKSETRASRAQIPPVKRLQQHSLGISSQLRTALEELHDKRCQECILCSRSECNVCSACKVNASERIEDQPSAKKLVCFKKMCCKLDYQFKAQAAPSLPVGWRFYFADPKEMPWKLDDVPEGLEGLVLISPEGKKFASVDKAYNALSAGGDVNSMGKAFYADIGCNVKVQHPLQGKKFCKRWVDVDGKHQVIYGKIVQVLPSNDGKHFTVEFDPESRALANENRTACRGLIPDRHRICEHFAYGGCFDAEKNSLPLDITHHYCTWFVPEIRHETMDRGDRGNFLPKVTIHFRGFQLVISPKISTIPNAGYGVFISCTNLLGTGEDFKLGPGELLDLGVYAPFRAEDVKLKHVFDLKNFLFSNICGEWTFDTVQGEKQLFDITDDATGELHDIAKRHIPAYVNETDGMAAPSITAQHDPAGSVHYLLGHYDDCYDALVLKADGVSREVFIDYGANYEDFRVRKGYSRLPKKDAEARKKELLETDHLIEMEELLLLDLEMITDCIVFMKTKWYNPLRDYPVSVISRGILALMLLRNRMDILIEEIGPDPLRRGERAKELGPCGKIQLQRSKGGELLLSLFEWWNDCNALKETFMSDNVLKSAMEFVLGPGTDLANISPHELENKVKGIEVSLEYAYT